ncbi:uncharacterized protein CLUP02_07553 [Colletotrichum lupini]|uniref:Uncharacterized protein n=1 Tax=Colletotrichum lupini TaxID=145971 RepID=A0A9Q8ST22_9PEZI|nr:uncharacterized protein CLUP02_07553 [Colletotrichum lupini]UQC82067.1 hypothetical protein CLUP02_07553 [Colletotrichum lupini]
MRLAWSYDSPLLRAVISIPLKGFKRLTLAVAEHRIALNSANRTNLLSSTHNHVSIFFPSHIRPELFSSFRFLESRI